MQLRIWQVLYFSALRKTMMCKWFYSAWVMMNSGIYNWNSPVNDCTLKLMTPRFKAQNGYSHVEMENKHWMCNLWCYMLLDSWKESMELSFHSLEYVRKRGVDMWVRQQSFLWPVMVEREGSCDVCFLLSNWAWVSEVHGVGRGQWMTRRLFLNFYSLKNIGPQ